MKFRVRYYMYNKQGVTLCVRVWIEIKFLYNCSEKKSVTLCVRVWIEMSRHPPDTVMSLRHPLREGVD